jgi:hypothetical protein
MVGREIRATVIRIGGPGGTVTLRSGGALIEARVRGQALQTGQHLFLRVEQDAPGRFRLLVLEPGTGVSAARFAFPRLAASGALATVLGAFLRHYNAKPPKSPEARFASEASGLSKSAERAAAGPASAAHTSTGRGAGDSTGSIVQDRLLQALREMSAQIRGLDQGSLAGLVAGLPAGEAPDLFLCQGWDLDSPADQSGHTEEPVREYVALLGRLAEPPYYFVSEVRMELTGSVGVLVLSPDQDFTRISLYLNAEREATADWLDEHLPHLQRELEPGIRWENVLVVRSPQTDGYDGGGLLDLQG